MPTIKIPRLFSLRDLPEIQRYKEVNKLKEVDPKQVVVMYAQAIHWLSITELLWPDFSNKDYYSVEVAYIFANDPDEKKYPPLLYQQIAALLKTCWESLLEDTNEWVITIRDDPEITVEAIRKHKKTWIDKLGLRNQNQ